MTRFGLEIDPIAGIDGRLGLTGTDGVIGRGYFAVLTGYRFSRWVKIAR